MSKRIAGFTQYFLIAALALGVFLFLTSRLETQTAHALPEYSDRTGEPCGACHVNPGGGGPRTLTGLIWAARGKPDAIPLSTNQLLAPGITDGAELYSIACAGCHGVKGEGLFGMRLTGTLISQPAIRSFVLEGVEPFGMPAFAGQFDDAQLEALLDYLAGLASGEIAPPLDQAPLPPPIILCDGPLSVNQSCREE